jgi:tRNA A37 threonylcarbamoyladenosine biosynthesis protein TsaE
MIESAAAPLDIALPDLAATAGLAKAHAARAVLRDVIALRGDLGLGKTTFARAFIQNRPGGV